jgi:hypothetical protein
MQTPLLMLWAEVNNDFTEVDEFRDQPPEATVCPRQERVCPHQHPLTKAGWSREQAPPRDHKASCVSRYRW